MRSTARRIVTLGAIILALSGCGVNDADIEHWKHTQRGPRKITTVLVESRYPQPLRVHAARALIEMKHPNASGLDLLQGAMQSMAAPDREPIVHLLVPELQNMMGTGAQPAPSAQGPTEQMIKAKDAAYILIRGDGRSTFGSAEDRTTLSNAVLDWLLADFNTRALAGSYTAEQIVTAIGPSATDRLGQAIAFTEQAIPVSVEVAKLVNAVAPPPGKQAVATRIVAVATEIEGPGGTDRLRTITRELLTRNNVQGITDAIVATKAEQLRNQYLTVLFEALKTLGQPAGTEYLMRVAANADAPIERRKNALTAAAGTINSSHAPALLAIANCAGGLPRCDVELRGIAIDRVGETRDRALLPQLYTLFDGANGTAADGGFIVRWKLGEAIVRLGGASELSSFMQHLGAPRAAPFPGYTFTELNGDAQAIGDITPPPRDVMRSYLTNNHPVPVRLLAMMYLGIKGEQQDLARLQAFTGEATAIQGEGWNDPQAQLTTVGAVANRTLQSLQQVLRQGQQVNPGGAAGTPPAR